MVRRQPRQVDRPGRLAEQVDRRTEPARAEPRATRSRARRPRADRRRARLAAHAAPARAHVLRRGRLPRQPRRAAPRRGARARGLHVAGAGLLPRPPGDRRPLRRLASRACGSGSSRSTRVGILFAYLLGRRLAGRSAGLLVAGADRGRADAAAARRADLRRPARDGARAREPLARASRRRSLAAGAVFAAAVLGEAERGDGGADARRPARARGRRGGGRCSTRRPARRALVARARARLRPRPRRDLGRRVLYHFDTTRASKGLGGCAPARELLRHEPAHAVPLVHRSRACSRRCSQWRRVWPLWLWPARARAVRAHVPAAARQPPDPAPVRVRGPDRGRARARRASGSTGGARGRDRGRRVAVLLAGGWVQQLHRVDLDRVAENPALVAAAAELERLTAPGRPRRRRPADRRRSSPTAACRRSSSTRRTAASSRAR